MYGARCKRPSTRPGSTHAQLVQGRLEAENRRRRWPRLRRLTLAVGGAFIAVSNPPATPLLGPFAIGVSVALGGGAAGAIANLIED
jgi:hypothetical protein